MPSKPNILIIGQNGSGKSRSFRTVFETHPEIVAFLDIERKGMPFLYDTKKLAFYKEIDSISSLDEALKTAINSPAQLLVIDSLTQLSVLIRDNCKSKYTGWDVWNGYNAMHRTIFKNLKASNKTSILTAVDEVVYIEQAEGSRASRIRAFIQGKELEGKVEGEFLIVLHAITKKDSNGKTRHVFRTHTDTISSAKSPEWLELSDEIDNDIWAVISKLKEKEQL